MPVITWKPHEPIRAWQVYLDTDLLRLIVWKELESVEFVELETMERRFAHEGSVRQLIGYGKWVRVW